MSHKHFPLRWESTGDQWWFASPIDYAAANGHYDLVLELLHLDTNLLIKLTSLPRLRRLETIWDDDDDHENSHAYVAKNRCHVAKLLYKECESKKKGGKNKNSLIRAGYGGWLLYTAAAAGDVAFVEEILGRDPLLVFGEGEYGVTDIMYGAARGKCGEVFRAVLECALFGREGEVGFKREILNRAVHAAARGGDVESMREVLGSGGGEDVLLGFRDDKGSTVLHTASGRGQVEVVKYLISSYDIITSVDNRGNTALNIAAYCGHLSVVEALISAPPSSVSLQNNYGDTFLHMAVSGFREPSFRRLDRQINLMKQIVSGNLVTNIEDIINVRNNDGRTALHIAVINNIQSEVVELLMSVRYINLNIRDGDGKTPLDLLKKRPRSASCEILIKRLISAGGNISNVQDDLRARSALASHMRLRGIGGSPGTSFKIPDAEIFLYTGIEHDVSERGYSGEIRPAGPKKLESMNSRLRNLLLRPGKTERNEDVESDMEDNYSIDSYKMRSSSKNSPIPLRQQYSRLSSLPNNKRVMPNFLPSPSTKEKYAAGLTRGVLQGLPRSFFRSPSSAVSESSWSANNDESCGSVGESSANQSPSIEKRKKIIGKQASLKLTLMNNYFCFGAQGLAAEKSDVKSQRENQNQESVVV